MFFAVSLMGVFLVLLHLDCKFATYRWSAQVYVNVSLKDTVYAASVCAIQRDKPLSLWDWDSSRSERGVGVREENN